jgi:hypothetical protein
LSVPTLPSHFSPQYKPEWIGVSERSNPGLDIIYQYKKLYTVLSYKNLIILKLTYESEASHPKKFLLKIKHGPKGYEQFHDIT